MVIDSPNDPHLRFAMTNNAETLKKTESHTQELQDLSVMVQSGHMKLSDSTRFSIAEGLSKVASALDVAVSDHPHHII
jgi:hypothetical protein